MQVFRSKKDWWLVAFVTCMSGLLLQLLLTMYAKGTFMQYPLHSAVYMLTIGVLWWPIFNTKYTIQANQLHIQCIFLHWTIPLDQISKVSPSNNSIASPALSLNRLKVEYQHNGTTKFILVSPQQPDEFCQAIQQNLVHS